ncbi:hypothetical protein BaRGS_00000242, partial [Batillaria attramentaria]
YGYSCCAVVSHISKNGALCVGSAIFGDIMHETLKDYKPWLQTLGLPQETKLHSLDCLLDRCPQPPEKFLHKRTKLRQDLKQMVLQKQGEFASKYHMVRSAASFVVADRCPLGIWPQM